MEEVEETKRRLQSKIQELTEAHEAANSKINSLEKARVKLIADLDDAQIDIERASGYAQSLEKKQHGFEKVIEEWKKKCDFMNVELDAVQRDARNFSSEMFKFRSTNEELTDALESLRRENRTLAQEVNELTEKLNEGGNSVHEMNKIIRKLEVEKEELKHGMSTAEAALEIEEGKVMRAHAEIVEIREEIEKRIKDKDEEIENTRRNHQRALESMQATLEMEFVGKTEMLRVKKKLESDINVSLASKNSELLYNSSGISLGLLNTKLFAANCMFRTSRLRWTMPTRPMPTHNATSKSIKSRSESFKVKSMRSKNKEMN